MVAKKSATKKYNIAEIIDFINSPDTEATLKNNRKYSKYFYKAYMHYLLLMWISCILSLISCFYNASHTEPIPYLVWFFLVISVFCFVMHHVSYKKHTYYGRMNDFLYSTIEHMKQTLSKNRY